MYPLLTLMTFEVKGKFIKDILDYGGQIRYFFLYKTKKMSMIRLISLHEY